MRFPSPPSRFRAAFTLIELMMVMFVMALITTIVATNAFGISRASSFSSAEDLLYNTLSLAHQQACMNNHEVCVVFLDETTFVVVEGVGRATKEAKGSTIYDPYPQRMTTYSGNNLTLWNLGKGEAVTKATLSKGEFTPKIPGVYIDKGTRERTYGFEAVKIEGTGKNSLPGNTYGVETLSRQTMPKGFKIGFGGKNTLPNNDFVHFYADGTSDGATVYAYEAIRSSENFIEIKVEKNGFVKVTKSAAGN